MSRQRGQSLMEMALCLPLFAIFLSFLIATVQLFRSKLELVRLTREFGSYLVRQEETEKRHSMWKADLQHLAEKGALHGLELDFTLEPLSVPMLAEFLPEDVAGKISSFASFAMGERLTLSCRVPAKGALRFFFFEGVQLKESAAIKTNPWKNPGMQLFRQVLSWLGLS